MGLQTKCSAFASSCSSDDREIARAAASRQGAVHHSLKKLAAAGIKWPLPEGWDRKRIEQALFGKRRADLTKPPAGFCRLAFSG